jgi:hypothetical protein
VRVRVEHWDAWAPGLRTADEWLAWSLDPTAEKKLETIQSTRIHAKLRRRSSHLAKMAIEVVEPSFVDSIDYTIFASQHGDVGCSLRLLKDIAEQETLSPTQFVQSVHNAPLGLFSIVYQLQENMTSLAAGDKTFAMAMLEAYTWLALNKHKRVLMVIFDEYIPKDYKALQVQSDYQYALALTLTHPAMDAPGIDVPVYEKSKQEYPDLPEALAFLAGFLQEHKTLRSLIPGECLEQEAAHVA